MKNIRNFIKKHSWLLLLAILGICFLSIQFVTAQSRAIDENTRVSNRATLTTEYLTGAVGWREVDYFALDAEPGLMSVSVSWGNSYDIDCYICETADYTSYLARGYTTNNPETCSYSLQTAGTYYIAIRMYSWRAVSTSYTVTVTYYTGGDEVDTEDPTVSITSPANNADVSDTITITASASDNVGVTNVACQLDGGSWVDDSTAPYSWTLDTTTISDGTHTIIVEAEDAAGNTAQDSISINVDNSGSGIIPIHQDLVGSVASIEVDYFEISAQPGLMEVSVSWGNSYDIDCYIMSSPDYTSYLVRGYTTSNPETCSYTIGTAGTYYIGIRMYTSGASSTDYTCSVDYYGLGSEDFIKPTVDITSPTNGATVQDTITISATASDNEGIDYLACQIDGGSWTTDIASPYSWTWDTTTVGDGSHIITVRAYDTSGNYQDDSVTVTVDNVVGEVGKYALIVGISDYKAISDLSYCDEDATDIYYYLVNVCGYEPENVIVLGDTDTFNYPKYDGLATEANIKYYLNWLAVQEGEITYTTSGHGSGNGEGSSYICAWDCGSGEDGEDGDLYDTEVAAILNNIAADQLFILIDHCYAGGFGPDLMAMNSASKVYCTTTCSDDGYGYDYTSTQNGAWTYFFFEYTLINYFGSNPSTTMEAAFDYALANYPYGGGDTPEEYDGNTGSSFILW